MATIDNEDSEIAFALAKEEIRQGLELELIPSENYVSKAVLSALGSVATNKYSEGYPGNRYYGGQEYMDEIETIAIERAKKLFDAKFANVQPLSGAPANLAVYSALMSPMDSILGMDLSHGGHLTHGHPVTLSAKMYSFSRYKTKNKKGCEIDYEEMRKTALAKKPKIILAGFSSYPGQVDYEEIVKIAKEVGAITVMDIAHIAGLIAGGALENPFSYGFDVMTTTTHKTLRGPRGGMILVRDSEEIAKKIDKAVFPGLQGGPHMNNIAAKAVAFKEALHPNFKKYAKQVLENAQAMAEAFSGCRAELVCGGTKNHIIMLDTVKSYGLGGKEAQKILEKVGLAVNKNVVPDDDRSPDDPSGIRMGTPAITSRGATKSTCRLLAFSIDDLLRNPEDSHVIHEVSSRVRELAKTMPIKESYI